MSKRPLDIDTAVATPTKKATVRRAQASNKRTSDEALSELTNTEKKKARQSESGENVEDGEKTVKKNTTRRNTERLSTLLEKNNIIPSPMATNRSSLTTSSSLFNEPEPTNGSEEETDAPVSVKKPRARKSLLPKTPEASSSHHNTSSETAATTTASAGATTGEKIKQKKPRLSIKSVPVASSTSVATAAVSVEQVSVPAPYVVPVVSAPTLADYNSASLKVPSTQELLNNDLSGDLAGFWTQCREALSFCCAALYPAFLAVIVVAYLLHFTTQQRIFASFAVVFTILSGIVMGFFFVAVVPFVVLTRTVECYLREKDRPDSVFVNLLTRIALLLVTFASLFVIQTLAQ